ncbi:NADH-quinone oxidoreductase subunit M [Shewanella sp. D64]|uniref:complex I subunit 4 family protein n=1 Tax=unclassified Shewanella TaxID=196818 RepID=UPI0022BA67BB|nr:MULTISPECIES: NADH-quinone oxidoreductase subunit M [unclassified Shewanella]MEC4724768.1 NADH-quinone oxidoreductase subunit M [Shewanella sp. D64]MEC4736438.1 NADH-quinone oxidoreductase subunit M [Shewanella sp. E94]WBJ97504.1 NADH-quinone oxidoreductase subunit M [Shewanella sp. MTB7]
MMLFTLILLPLIGGVIACWSQRVHQDAPKWVTCLCLLLSLAFLTSLKFGTNIDASNLWLVDETLAWIPRLNISAHLAMDGLSFVLILLTLLMGLVGLSSAWNEISQHTGFFYGNYLWTLAGIIGVFLAMDLLLFFVFWEVMLVPMYFLIAIWGNENRRYAALKFFLFTQTGGLLMLLSIIALAVIHYQQTQILSFDYQILVQSPIESEFAKWICLGFIIAFIVKLPAFPFHSWLPDAHTQAPTPASIILAAVLLKTGGYGLLRFVLPLFPDASQFWSPLMMGLAGVSIIYGAMMAFSQTDLKRLVAYSSVSHMGFVLLGCFSLNFYALQGAVMQMLAHGISTAALFMLVGLIQHKFHTRDLNQVRGLWNTLPKLSAMGLFFGVASLGMPGLGNFIAELLVLIGTFKQAPMFALVATSGLILAAVYSLRMIQKSFFGVSVNSDENIKTETENSNKLDSQTAHPPKQVITDLNTKEKITLMLMCLALILMGLHPQPIFNLVNGSLMEIALLFQTPFQAPLQPEIQLLEVQL